MFGGAFVTCKGTEVRRRFWWKKVEGKRHSERRGSRWEDNVKMHLKEIRQQNVD
jgi:hypothetical protein